MAICYLQMIHHMEGIVFNCFMYVELNNIVTVGHFDSYHTMFLSIKSIACTFVLAFVSLMSVICLLNSFMFAFIVTFSGFKEHFPTVYFTINATLVQVYDFRRKCLFSSRCLLPSLSIFLIHSINFIGLCYFSLSSSPGFADFTPRFKMTMLQRNK